MISMIKKADGALTDAAAGMGDGKIADVIQYEGSNDIFILKHEREDFNTGSQLIVHESQEAVFFMNGQALDLFGPGRHTLETQNLPLVGKFFNAPTGGVTPFHCEVYFINKTEQLAVKWGTDTKLGYIEPKYGFPVRIGASGEMSLRVEDSRKLLVKVVGTEKGISQQGFVQKIRGFLMTRLKAHLANYMKAEQINIFEVDEHLVTISEALRGLFKPDFLDYGIALERFAVNVIVPDEDENFKAARDAAAVQVRLARQEATEAVRDVQVGREAKRTADAERYQKERAADAEGYRLRQMGITRQEELQADVLKTMAGNESVGQVSNPIMGATMMAGVGLPIGAAVGGMMRDTVGGVLGDGRAVSPRPPDGAFGERALPCVHCAKPLPANARFCSGCGQQVVAENEVVCPGCGKKTAKGKFCAECGGALIKKCPKCGVEVPTGGKFCADCGEKV